MRPGRDASRRPGRLATGTSFTVPVLAMLGALSATIDGFSVVAAAAGAVVGALWALLLGLLVVRVAPRARLADRSVLVAAFLAAVLLGGSTFAMLAYAAAYSDGDALVAFASAPIAGGFLFFVIVNTAIEWLALPVALHLSWASRRQRLVVVAALLYYAMRASTYLYFAPAIMELGAASLDDQGIASLRTWVLLSVPRWVVDVVLAVLLLLAARRPTTVRASSTTPVSA
jgi:hypothetical protein